MATTGMEGGDEFDLLGDDWIVTYDENGVVVLQGVNKPDKKISLEHGTRLNLLTPVPPLQCALCESALEPVFPQNPHANQRKALRFAFSGGYGEYIDFVSGPVEGILCKVCADELVKGTPKLDEFLRSSL